MNSLLILSRHGERQAEIPQSRGKIRPDRQRPAKAFDRLVQLPLHPQSFPKIAQGLWKIRLQGNRLTNQTGAVRLARGNPQCSEQMQSIGLIRLSIQDLPVDRFRFRQPARLMMLERNLNRLLDRRLRHGWLSLADV